MLALYRSGRQADALAVMQDARATLRDELGLDPGQALQQLERAILLQDPSLDETFAAPPTRLPPAPIESPVRPRAATARRARHARAAQGRDGAGRGRHRLDAAGESLDPEVVRTMLATYFDRDEGGGRAARRRGREVHRRRRHGRLRRARPCTKTTRYGRSARRWRCATRWPSWASRAASASRAAPSSQATAERLVSRHGGDPRVAARAGGPARRDPARRGDDARGGRRRDRRSAGAARAKGQARTGGGMAARLGRPQTGRHAASTRPSSAASRERRSAR